MRLDFTKEVTLDSKYDKLYRRLQIAVYALAFLSGLYLTYSILFPKAYFTFSFQNPNSLSNGITALRLNTGASPDHGDISQKDTLTFYSALVGNYSKAKISFILDKKSPSTADSQTIVRKSYQAFLYPEGDPVGFKDGSLIKNNNGYYIISNGVKRQFKNIAVFSQMGFSPEAFREVDNNDPRYNPSGEIIADQSNYPDSTVFKINGDYYILDGGQLDKFVSEKAYLTQYEGSVAVVKDEAIFQKYAPSQNLTGFADGTLIAYGISAYIVSGTQVLPINNVATFESMGYDWADLINASGDEFSLYQKDKLFTLSSPHPNGTIFITKENGDYYLIKDNQKHLLPSKNIAQTWLRKKPILVSDDSQNISQNCSLTKDILSSRNYSCQIPLDDFNNLIGKDWEFKLSSGEDVKLDTLNVVFEKTVTWDNLKLSLSNIITRVKNNYVQ